MSLVQNVNSLAEAVGLALKNTNSQIDANSALIKSLQTSVNNLQTTLQQVEELVQQVRTKVIITDTDPGEGSALETDAVLIVVNKNA